MNRIASRFALALLGTLVALILAECIVRRLDLAPQFAPLEISTGHGDFTWVDDPVLKYLPRPGAPGVNNLGFRDRDRSVEKTPYTLRVVTLGDSIAYGYCTPEFSHPREKVFTRIAEEMLNLNSPKRYEVLNLAVSGYDIEQEVRLLETHGLELHPDVVVVAYCLNDDVRGASIELKQFSSNGAELWGRQVLRRLLTHSYLFRWVAAMLASVNSHDVVRVQDFEMRRKSFQALKSFASAGKFQIIVLIFPNLSSRSVGTNQLTQVVQADAESFGFDVVDLLPVFLEAGAGRLETIRGRCSEMHPDEGGHRLVAEQLANKIKDIHGGSYRLGGGSAR